MHRLQLYVRIYVSIYLYVFRVVIAAICEIGKVLGSLYTVVSGCVHINIYFSIFLTHVYIDWYE